MIRLLREHWSIVLLIVCVLAHALLREYLAASGTVATLFAISDHIPIVPAMLAVTFLLLRLFVFVVLTGLAIYHLLTMIFRRRHMERTNQCAGSET